MNSGKKQISQSAIILPHLIEYIQNIFLGKDHYENYAQVHDAGIFDLANQSQRKATVVKSKNFDSEHLSIIINQHAWNYIQDFENHLRYKTGLFIPTRPEAPSGCDDPQLNAVVAITKNLAIIWDWANTWKNSFDELQEKRHSLFPHEVVDRPYQISYPKPPEFQAWLKDLEHEDDYKNYLEDLLSWSNSFLHVINEMHSDLTKEYKRKPVIIVKLAFEKSSVVLNLDCLHAPTQHFFQDSKETKEDDLKESKTPLSPNEKSAQSIIQGIRERIFSTPWKLGLFGGKTIQDKTLPTGLFEMVNLIDKGPIKGSWINLLKEIYETAQRHQSITHTPLNARKAATQIIYRQITSDEKIQGLIKDPTAAMAPLKPLQPKGS